MQTKEIDDLRKESAELRKENAELCKKNTELRKEMAELSRWNAKLEDRLKWAILQHLLCERAPLRPALTICILRGPASGVLALTHCQPYSKMLPTAPVQDSGIHADHAH